MTTYELDELEQPDSPEPSSDDLRRRRRVLAVAGAGVALVVGVVAVVRSLGGPSYAPAVYRPPAAVTASPDVAWTWTAQGRIGNVAPLDHDHVYVATERGLVTALDGRGEERWSTSVSRDSYLSADRDGDVLLAMDWTNERTVALESSSGKVLWKTDGMPTFAQGSGSAIFAHRSEVWRVDLESGRKVWEAQAAGDTFASQGAVVVLDDGEARFLDAEDGHEVWTADVGDEADDDNGPDVVTAADFTVVAVDHDATAFDNRSGDRLWHVPLGAGYAAVGLASPTRVYLVEDDDPRQTVRIYDKGGRVADLTTDDDQFYGVPFTSGDHDYLLDYASGAVWDVETCARVGKAPLDESRVGLTLAEGGFYDSDGGELEYTRLGETSPAWRRSGRFDRDTTLVAGERQILAVRGAQVTAYE
jgi:outer membrane protein assembly factor BamB